MSTDLLRFSPLADLLTRPGPEFSLDPHHPLVFIGSLATLGSIVCLIWTLIKLGKTQGSFHVLLGIISCAFYPFIWAWIAPPELRTRRIAIAWTVFTVIAISLSPAPGMSPRPPDSPSPYPGDTRDMPPPQTPTPH